MKQYNFLNEQLTLRKMMPRKHQLRSYRRELRKAVDKYKDLEKRRGISDSQVKKNLNPLYLMEAHFLSGKDAKSGWKLFKNGIKKNGLLKTLSRNKQSDVKRGLHVAKTRGVDKTNMNDIVKYKSKTLSDIGKRARKGIKQSSSNSKTLTKLSKLNRDASPYSIMDS